MLHIQGWGVGHVDSRRPFMLVNDGKYSGPQRSLTNGCVTGNGRSETRAETEDVCAWVYCTLCTFVVLGSQNVGQIASSEMMGEKAGTPMHTYKGLRVLQQGSTLSAQVEMMKVAVGFVTLPSVTKPRLEPERYRSFGKGLECSPGSAPALPFPRELSSQPLAVQHPLPCFEQGSVYRLTNAEKQMWKSETRRKNVGGLENKNIAVVCTHPVAPFTSLQLNCQFISLLFLTESVRARLRPTDGVFLWVQKGRDDGCQGLEKSPLQLHQEMCCRGWYNPTKGGVLLPACEGPAFHVRHTACLGAMTVGYVFNRQRTLEPARVVTREKTLAHHLCPAVWIVIWLSRLRT